MESLDAHRLNRRSVDRIVLDPMYGPIKHGPEDELAWQLYKTAALMRLRDISLSSVPSRMSPTGEASSRFEHSVGVSYLVRELCKTRSAFAPYRNELVAAALLHDSASVPFSHIGETFQYAMTNQTHEEAVARILDGRTEVGRLVRKFGVDPDRILDLINGRHPELGGILASSVDADSIDNSLRLLAALGGLGADRRLPYNPKNLVLAFRLVKGQISLDTTALKDLIGWQETRFHLYHGILYEEQNLAAAAMVYRAVEFAHDTGALGSEFFGWGESQAIEWLRTTAVPASSRKLMDAALRWKFYQQCATIQGDEANTGYIKRLSQDWTAKRHVANQIAVKLGLRPDDVCVYAGRDKGAKVITHPFVGPNAEAVTNLFSGSVGEWRAACFLHPEAATQCEEKKILDALGSCLLEVEPIAGEAKVFF